MNRVSLPIVTGKEGARKVFAVTSHAIFGVFKRIGQKVDWPADWMGECRVRRVALDNTY
jgi:hypothetical protein